MQYNYHTNLLAQMGPHPITLMKKASCIENLLKPINITQYTKKSNWILQVAMNIYYICNSPMHSLTIDIRVFVGKLVYRLNTKPLTWM